MIIYILEAAITLQRYGRGYLGRRRALLHRKIANAIYYEKGQNVMHFLIRRRLVKYGATLVLQTMMKKRKGRTIRRALRSLLRIRARNLIQRRVLGWYERIKVAKWKVVKHTAALDMERYVYVIPFF
jgi:hypothetical protein